MSPEEGVTAILVAEGAGVAAPSPGLWPIFEATFPDQTNQCILVKVTGGRQPEVRIAIDYPSMQILIRSMPQNYIVARAKAEEIWQILQAIPSEPPAYPELTSAVAVTQPIFVGYDEEDLPVWSVNFNLIISKPPEGHRDL